jgi:hypothetical protein
VQVTWTDESDDEAGFRVERRVPGGAFAEVGTTGPDTTRFVDTGVSPGAPYEYRARAFNEYESPFSNADVVTTPKAGKLVLDPRSLGFGQRRVGTRKTKVLSVKNSGAGPLPVEVGALAPPFAVEEGGGSFVLGRGQRRNVVIAFAPEAPGPVKQSLGIVSDDPARRSASVSVSGKGK